MYRRGNVALVCICGNLQLISSRVFFQQTLSLDTVMRKLVPYSAPSWAAHLQHIPSHRLQLINGPTPVQPWSFEHQGKTYSLHIKRDDLTESVQAGNKSRKLEFLFAAALADKADAVVSIGGTGSNHCRAVAAFAGPLGLPCHLVLRRDKHFDGTTVQGNMLLDNVFGANIHIVSREQYQRDGSGALVQGLADRLVANGTFKKPSVIPVGGSNSIGVWGYIEAVREMEAQMDPDEKIDVVCFASGSGGTAAG